MAANDARLNAILPLINKPCDVFELVAALHQYRDVAIQDVLCSKLYEAKSHEIEFFLPQLWYVRSNDRVALEAMRLRIFRHTGSNSGLVAGKRLFVAYSLVSISLTLLILRGVDTSVTLF